MDRGTLEAALIGYRQQVTDISAKITEIERMLRGVKSPKGALLGKWAPLEVVRKPKRKMSDKARASIAKAQRARWKAYHAAQNKAS